MNKTLVVRFLFVSVSGFFAIVLLFWLFVAFKILSGSSNHTGVNIGWLQVVPIAGSVFATALFAYTRRIIHLLAALLFVLSIAGIHALDHYNILLPYEVWLKRGMPARMTPNS
jgi:hypothetical protein